MLKRDITYMDFSDPPKEVTETFYFHISENEIIELEFEHSSGLEAFIKKISATEDNKALYAEFKKIVLLAYGERSPDGKRFDKSEELRRNFANHAAFNALIFEFFTKDDAAVDFIKGCLPTSLPVVDQDKPLSPPELPNIQRASTPGNEDVL